MRRDRWLLAGNVATLALTLFVASASYAVLSATTETNRLDVRGAVSDNAATAAYDVLVRPVGAISDAEESSVLVQPGFLGATAGGVSLRQWRQVQGLRGVEVAAPVAVLGWTVPYVTVQVDLGDLAQTTVPVVVRRTGSWAYDNGASSLTGAPVLLYVTPNPVSIDVEEQQWVETRPDGTVITFPLPAGPAAETVEDRDDTLFVISTADLATSTVAQIPFPFPFLIAAVDPEAEAELSGVEGALVDGEWLAPGATGERTFAFPDGQSEVRAVVPVVVADRPLMQMSSSYTIDVLEGAEVRRIATEGLEGPPPGELFNTPGRVLASGTFDQDRAYDEFLGSMATATSDGRYYARSVLKVHRTSQLEVRLGAGGELVPRPVRADLSGWGNQATPGDVVDSIVPPGGDDTAFRRLDGFFFEAPDFSPIPPPALVRTGVFDAARLPGTTTLARVPLGTFAFAAPRAADAGSLSELGGEDWFPATTVAGYLQPPPLMLTSLDALAPFRDPEPWVEAGDSGLSLGGSPPIAGPPISAIRVRVEGVDGVTALDRERVRGVAEEIAETTGLVVDITLGSSPSAQEVTVAAGVHGRDELSVTELWVSKGVAVQLVRGIDRASLLLSLVVLLAAALVVVNAVFASVHARRREIGILLSLGWSPRHVASRVLLPVLLVALAAGLAGAGAAHLIRTSLELENDAAGVLLAVPAAFAVALVAAVGPAIAAARTSPVLAVRPPERRPARRRLRRIASVTGVALNSVSRAPGRAWAAVTGVGIATAAAGSLLAIQVEFQGRAAGSLLGDAVAVQVRTPDLVAAVLTMVLAGFGVHHTMATEIRERRSELATLRTVGWADTTIVRLLLSQAAVLAVLGAGGGGLVAWWFLGRAFETRTAAMAGALVASGAVAVLLALLVTLLPALSLRSQTVSRLLSDY